MSIDPSAVTPVHAFADRAWEQFLELNPLMATVQGDDRWDDQLGDPGPDGRAAMLAVLAGWEAEMDGFAGLELSVEDQVTLGTIEFIIERIRKGQALRLWHFEAMDALEWGPIRDRHWPRYRTGVPCPPTRLHSQGECLCYEGNRYFVLAGRRRKVPDRARPLRWLRRRPRWPLWPRPLHQSGP